MTTQFTNLKKITNNINKLINLSEIFNIELKYEINKIYNSAKTNAYYIKFYFDEDNYSVFLYYNDYETNNYLYAICKDVNSTYGNYIGTFLFNIQMLLVYLSNTQKINLDNYTDNPDRAAMGIYSLLDVDKRGETREEFYGKNLEEQLLISEGKMYLNINTDTILLVFNKFTEIVNKLDVDKCNIIWNNDYYEKMKKLINYFKLYY